MKILLIGHTGYVGGVVLKKLSLTNHQVQCISRRVLDDIQYPNVQYLKGDVLLPETYLNSVKNSEVIIYLPGLIREFPAKGITFENIHFWGVKNLVDASKLFHIKKFILMSANGVMENASTNYLRTKFKAEEYLKASNLEWTIFKPSIVFGYENQKKMNFINLIIELSSFPIFFPIIGNGNYRFQPVALDNLADAIVMSIDNPKSVNQTYYACGERVFSYNEIVEIILSVIGKRRIKLHLPVWLMNSLARFLEKYEWFPVSREQIKMLLEENLCKGGRSIFEDFPIIPIDFVEEMKNILSS